MPHVLVRADDCHVVERRPSWSMSSRLSSAGAVSFVVLHAHAGRGRDRVHRQVVDRQGLESPPQGRVGQAGTCW